VHARIEDILGVGLMSKNRIALISLIMLLSSMMLVSLAVAQVGTVGVSEGDWFKFGYDIEFSDERLDPNLEDVEWNKFSVTEISGTLVTGETTIRYKNGTEQTVGSYIDVYNFNIANITANMLISTHYNLNDVINNAQHLRIDEIISITYQTEPRETYHCLYIINGSNHDSYFDYYWDKETGILTKLHMFTEFKDDPDLGSATVSVTIKLIESNIPEIFARANIREFNFTFGENTYNVVTSSNSTIESLNLNQTLKQISFNVTGPTETTGFCNITIPDDLLWGDFAVYMDDSLLEEGVDYVKTYNGTHYAFHITYNHSTHTIDIRGTGVIPEFQTWGSMLLMLIVLTVSIVIYKRKPKHHSTNN